MLKLAAIGEAAPPLTTSHRHCGCDPITEASCEQQPEEGVEVCSVMYSRHGERLMNTLVQLESVCATVTPQRDTATKNMLSRIIVLLNAIVLRCFNNNVVDQIFKWFLCWFLCVFLLEKSLENCLW